MSGKELQLEKEQSKFIVRASKEGIHPRVIASSFQRKYGILITPLQIAGFLEKFSEKSEIDSRRQEVVESIKNKVGTHEEQLEMIRTLIRERMIDPEVGNHSLVELAAEYRKNIQASHELASMNDNATGMQFVLIYGDDVITKSEGAVVDVEFEVVTNE